MDEEGDAAQGVEAGGRPIRLLICDDHRLLTETLSVVIDQDEGITLVSPPVHTPEEAIDIARAERPDVALMDVNFQGSRMDGLEATRLIKEASPLTRVLVMTATDDERMLVAAVEAGAAGFLRKTEGMDEFLGAIRRAAEGEMLIDSEALARLLPLVAVERERETETQARFAQVTAREREILQLLANGMGNAQVAKTLFISPQTVQTHVRNTLGKLAVHSKLEAVVLAVRYGVVSV